MCPLELRHVFSALVVGVLFAVALSTSRAASPVIDPTQGDSRISLMWGWPPTVH
jgi:hypothetical protein